MEYLKPVVEIHILTDFKDEKKEYKWIKIIADNAYIRTQENMSMAHYKIDERAFIKLLKHYDNIKEYEKYATNEMLDLCLIKFSFNGENYEFRFDYSNEDLMRLAKNLYNNLTMLIDFYSIDFEV